MIQRETCSGDVVRAPDGRIGLVTGWVDEGDSREAMIVMRRGPAEPFDFHAIPIARYLKEFYLLGNIETEFRYKSAD